MLYKNCFHLIYYGIGLELIRFGSLSDNSYIVQESMGNYIQYKPLKEPATDKS